MKINWKYILGEIILIFVGITLAIWFNNWNAFSQSNRQKKQVISKVEKEIANNSQELEQVIASGKKIIDAIEVQNKLKNNQGKLMGTPDQIRKIQRNFPRFLIIEDSVELDSNRFEYNYSNKVVLDLIELSDIAWNTAQAIGITNEFNYNCLYEIQAIYNLQMRVQKEINKASDALQNGNPKKLIDILKFLDQLGAGLQERYKLLPEHLELCN